MCHAMLTAPVASTVAYGMLSGESCAVLMVLFIPMYPSTASCVLRCASGLHTAFLIPHAATSLAACMLMSYNMLSSVRCKRQQGLMGLCLFGLSLSCDAV